jgi:hypothetical protein
MLRILIPRKATLSVLVEDAIKIYLSTLDEVVARDKGRIYWIALRSSLLRLEQAKLTGYRKLI